MTELLEKAFTEASKLPTEDQDAFAAWILDELASDHRWEEVFSRSRDRLDHLADEALAEYYRRHTNDPTRS